MRHVWLGALVAAALAVGLAHACAIAQYDDEAGTADARDARDDDGGVCDPGTCLRTCMSLGVGGGRCVGAECTCETLDGPSDTPPADVGTDVPVSCDPWTCDSACRSFGASGGSCVGSDCRCESGPDADADAAPVDDGGVEDAAPVDDGGVDDAPVDEGLPDEVRVDDGGVDDAPIDEGTVDDAPPVDDGGTVAWGVPVCNATGGTLSDRGIFGGATTMSQSVTVPALGTVKAIRLEITIPSRRFVIANLPFDDLQVTLAGPGGISRRFWYHFQGDSTGGSFPTYSFFTPWILPDWWDAAVGGTWTLTIRDDVFSGVNTTLTSWCVTPLNPADYASTDTAARMSVCDTTSHSITDYCYGDPPDPCTDHPVRFEVQASSLVRASGAATLTLDVSHAAPSQLRIDLTAADGTGITVWNRGSGAIPTSIPLPDLTGRWLTGRYQIRVVDMVEGTTGTLRNWCVQAN